MIRLPMTDEPTLLPEVDTPPKSGTWAEEHPRPTLEEIAAGNHLGRAIDVDDDDDNGLDL